MSPLKSTATALGTVLKYVGLMVGTALFTLALATALGGGQRDLASRVDRNAEVTVSGVAAVVCILNIEPQLRTDQNLDACLVANGFDGVVKNP